MTDLPIVMTPAGMEPQQPADIQATLLSNVAAVQPGYTANLPGILIEDISSTDVGAIALCDSALVELVNSITPQGANQFLLQQLGNQAGVVPGQASNTSVYVVFSGTVGFLVPSGFLVTDGAYQYSVIDGGVVGASGSTAPLYCVATQSGSWAVPAGTVQGIATSVPSTITLTCNNPTTGTPGGPAESADAYRARVLAAGLAASTGMPRYLRTLLSNVADVEPRLISVVQIPGQGWEVICGGGDQYAVAYAIYEAIPDINALQGSVMSVTAISKAASAIVTTSLNHGYSVGQVAQINGATGMTLINGVNFIVLSVISQTSFAINVDTTGYATYTGNGVLTPNLRNLTVNINDYPDTYGVTFVNPPQQTVSMTVTWNTPSTNYVNPVTIAELVTPALVNYINGIVVGQPINIFVMNDVVQEAVSSVLSSQLLTRLVFSVDINGVGVSPTAGTGIIPGDPESYFLTNASLITVLQG